MDTCKAGIFTPPSGLRKILEDRGILVCDIHQGRGKITAKTVPQMSLLWSIRIISKSLILCFLKKLGRLLLCK